MSPRILTACAFITIGGAVAACDTAPTAAPDDPSTAAAVFEPVADTAESAAPLTAGAKVNVPGKTVRTLVVDGLARELIVYVPRKAQGSRLVPVVFMLHGTSGDGEKFYRISGWREKADEEGFIAVFPSALTHCFFEDENRDGDFDDRGELKVTTKWAAGKLGDPLRMPLCSDRDLARLSPDKRALADHPLADDIAFFDAMLDFLTTSYAVDARSIYASGFSNGGEMTSRLGLEMNDRFAALAAAGGAMSLPPEPAPRPLYMVFSVGAQDDRFTTAYGVDEFVVSEDFLSDNPAFAERIVSKFLTLCGLTEDYAYQERMAGQYPVGDFAFTTPVEAGSDSEFHFVLIDGLGHQYPNGKNHPLRLANPLWDFFRTKHLP